MRKAAWLAVALVASRPARAAETGVTATLDHRFYTREPYGKAQPRFTQGFTLGAERWYSPSILLFGPWFDLGLYRNVADTRPFGADHAGFRADLGFQWRIGPDPGQERLFLDLSACFAWFEWFDLSSRSPVHGDFESQGGGRNLGYRLGIWMGRRFGEYTVRIGAESWPPLGPDGSILEPYLRLGLEWTPR